MSEKKPSDFGVAPLEVEREGELRIFCMFYNNKTGKYRVTQGDSVFVVTQAREVPFHEAILTQIKKAAASGVDVSFFEKLGIEVSK